MSEDLYRLRPGHFKQTKAQALRHLAAAIEKRARKAWRWAAICEGWRYQ
jgi:hypothetical protein